MLYIGYFEISFIYGKRNQYAKNYVSTENIAFKQYDLLSFKIYNMSFKKKCDMLYKATSSHNQIVRKLIQLLKYSNFNIGN